MSIPGYLPVFTAAFTSSSVPTGCGRLVGLYYGAVGVVSTIVHFTAVSWQHLQHSIVVSDQLTIFIIDDSCSLLFGFGKII